MTGRRVDRPSFGCHLMPRTAAPVALEGVDGYATLP